MIAEIANILIELIIWIIRSPIVFSEKAFVEELPEHASNTKCNDFLTDRCLTELPESENMYRNLNIV